MGHGYLRWRDRTEHGGQTELTDEKRTKGERLTSGKRKNGFNEWKILSGFGHGVVISTKV